MSEDKKIKMLEVAKILFLNGVPIEQSKYIGGFIEELNGETQRLEIQLEWYDKTLEEKQKEITKRDKKIGELTNRIEKAKHFIDQVLGYHLNDYKQLEKDVNELYGILMEVDSDESKVVQ